jgi:hypothetical protein
MSPPTPTTQSDNFHGVWKICAEFTGLCAEVNPVGASTGVGMAVCLS